MPGVVIGTTQPNPLLPTVYANTQTAPYLTAHQPSLVFSVKGTTSLVPYRRAPTLASLNLLVTVLGTLQPFPRVHLSGPGTLTHS